LKEKYLARDSLSNNALPVMPHANVPWVVHELRENMNTIREFWACKAEIYKASNKASIPLSIIQEMTISQCQAMILF